MRGTGPLAVLDPDETTIAMLDHGLRTPFIELHTDSATPQQRGARNGLRGRGAAAHLLVKLPGARPARSSAGSAALTGLPAPDDGVAAELVTEASPRSPGAMSCRRRRYALLPTAVRSPDL